MIKALLSVRLWAMLASFMPQSQRTKKNSKAMRVLFAVLYLYLGVVFVGFACLLFSQLAPAYHAMELDWLYFAMAGLMGLGASVFGSVFSTQSQLYDAKDNDLLLSMPVTPAMILLSRMVPLLGLNAVFAGVVMIPAAVMYAVLVAFSPVKLLLQLLGMAAVCFLAQGISCLLGWFLHLLLRRMNKSLASLLYMIVFLAAYFGIYSQAENLMNGMVADSAALASGMQSWIWPLYALGVGCTGRFRYLLIFMAICGAVFAAVYWVLSVTFLHTATYRRSVKRRSLNMGKGAVKSPVGAIVYKEWRHFLGSPVYLTNMGVGILMTAALAVAGVVCRDSVLELLEQFTAIGVEIDVFIPLIICAMLAALSAMMFVSAPSVSLEGKNLWVLKSMPLSVSSILQAKLAFHCLLTVPVMVIAGLTLAAVYGCGIGGVLLCGLVGGLLPLLCGVTGMVFGLKWAKLDWLSEAYPCKQGMAVGITMLTMMGLPVVLGAGYFLLAGIGCPPDLYLLLCAVVLAGSSYGLYRLMMTWGVRKWNSL